MKKLNPKTWFVLCVVLVCGVLAYPTYQKVEVYLMNKALDDLIANAPDIPISAPAVPEGKPVVEIHQYGGRSSISYNFLVFKNLVVESPYIGDPTSPGMTHFRIDQENFRKLVLLFKKFGFVDLPGSYLLDSHPGAVNSDINYVIIQILGKRQIFSHSPGSMSGSNLSDERFFELLRNIELLIKK